MEYFFLCVEKKNTKCSVVHILLCLSQNMKIYVLEKYLKQYK